MIIVTATRRTDARETIAFLAGAQESCVHVMGTRKIRVWVPATPVAHAPTSMRGVINLRGAVLPIAVRLVFPATMPTSRHAVLAVEIGTQSVGLGGQAVSEILTVGPEVIQPAPDVASRMAQTMVERILALYGRLLSLLDLGAVLPRGCVDLDTGLAA